MVRKVWFKVLAQDGAVLVPTDFVRIAESKSIAQLRKVIFEDIHNALPQDAVASSLTVYESAKAKLSLRPSTLIGSKLGRIDDDRLVIKVTLPRAIPPQTGSATGGYASNAALCLALETARETLKTTETISRVVEQAVARLTGSVSLAAPRECVLVADVTHQQCSAILNSLKLSVNVLSHGASNLSQDLPGFEWDVDIAQGDNAMGDDGYRQYLSNLLKPALDTAGLELRHDVSYTISDQRLPFDLLCGADALVLGKTTGFVPQLIQHMHNLNLVVRLDMTLGESDDDGSDDDDSSDDDGDNDKQESPSVRYQPSMVVHLVGVNLKAPQYIAMVLHTNLDNVWDFYWLGQDRTISLLPLKDPGMAKEFITGNLSTVKVAIPSDDERVLPPPTWSHFLGHMRPLGGSLSKMLRKVWFEVLDCDGEVLVPTDYVSIVRDEDVVWFRKAVYWENRSALPGTAVAAHLVVYRDKQEIDTKKPPLKCDENLGRLGLTPLCKLVVVVMVGKAPDYRTADADQRRAPTTNEALMQRAAVKLSQENVNMEAVYTNDTTARSSLCDVEDKPRECYLMSDITCEHCNQTLSALKLEVKIHKPNVPTSNDITIAPFQWKNVQMHEQAGGDTGYYVYLMKALRVALVLGTFSLAHSVSFRIADKRMPFDMACSADLAVFRGESVSEAKDISQMHGLRLVVCIDKDLASDDDFDPALAVQLIGVNLEAPEKLAIILETNLRDQWHFMWVGVDRTIRMLVLKDPTCAFKFIAANISRKVQKIELLFPNPPKVPRRGDLTKLLAKA